MSTAPTPLILVVDDDPTIAALVCALLERDGYATRRAHSGPEALEVVACEPITLLLLDVMMPDMDGFAVCRALRDAGRRLPVILLTGRDDLSTRQRGMQEGVSEFLTKPIDTHELRARVRAQVHIVSLTAQLETVERNLRAVTAGTGSRTSH
jgi:DNA-binding response OmpR family regulator